MSTQEPTLHQRVLERARGILMEEGEAVLRKGKQLDESFVELVRVILNYGGHVAITGVGKSGIIGEKIAATLSSTGTPSFFLRPVEAMHGDLGMLSSRDLLLAISASGETAEVLAVVQAALALRVQVVAFTGVKQSSLARAASLVIDVGVEREACPLGLAPTASTTVTLAVGDALAMVLLEERGFTKEHYLRFHPGGSLGERLRFEVRDLMRCDDRIPMVEESVPLRDALREMTECENLGVTLVVADGELRGIVTDGDVRRALLPSDVPSATLLECPVSRFMSPNPRTIEPDASAAEAMQIMEVHGITSLAVVDHRHHALGVVHLHDILGRGKFSL